MSGIDKLRKFMSGEKDEEATEETPAEKPKRSRAKKEAFTKHEGPDGEVIRTKRAEETIVFPPELMGAAEPSTDVACPVCGTMTNKDVCEVDGSRVRG